MARTAATIPGGMRLTDHISLGVLTAQFPLVVVERVLHETGRMSERERALPAHAMVYYAIALGLYADVSTQEVLRCVVEGARWLGDPLAQHEVPVPLALRLYLPEMWASDAKDSAERRERAKVPETVSFQTKGEIALRELDRVMAGGVRFGVVLADAGYGSAAEFRAGLTARGLTWAVGVLGTQKVYPADVTLTPPVQGPTGRPRKHPVPSATSVSAEAMIEGLGPRAFHRTTWRRGTKGPLRVAFAAVRVRVADGPLTAKAQHLPGDEAWLVCERRTTGERKYYLTNHPDRTSRLELLRAIKARWSCEQVHQQLKEELGLDHFEGRSWLGLHHHALLTMIAFAFLQHRRLDAARTAARNARRRDRRRAGGKTGAHQSRDSAHARSTSTAFAPSNPSSTTRRPAHRNASSMSTLSGTSPAAAA